MNSQYWNSARRIPQILASDGESLAYRALRTHVQFSRHAKNGARSIGVTVADAEDVIANPLEINVEANGKRHYIGLIRGQRVRVIVAFDDPDLIVTIHRRRR